MTNEEIMGLAVSAAGRDGAAGKAARAIVSDAEALVSFSDFFRAFGEMVGLGRLLGMDNAMYDAAAGMHSPDASEALRRFAGAVGCDRETIAGAAKLAVEWSGRGETGPRVSA